MAHEREDVLADLLLDLFSEPELRQMLTSVGDRELLVALPSSSSPVVLAHEAVAALRRRGKIDRELFERLVALRPGRAADIAGVHARWNDVLVTPTSLADTNEAPASRTLAGTLAYLSPEARQTVGGLRLIDIRLGSLPALRFTLKNESPGSLTLTSVVLEAVCHESWMLLSPPRPIAPAEAWDLELPAQGGRREFSAEPVYVLPPDAVHMLEIRCHVLRAGAQKVPPGHCGRYTLRFGFLAGEGASAFSEPIQW
ncbi:MAG: hypothetical protein IPK80_21400 [Nannocystis sp.]|nr:hypothetical protein [Nannocystis sp.]